MTPEEIKAQNEAVLKAVHDLKSTVDKATEEKAINDTLVQESLKKQGEDILVMQRETAEIKKLAEATTIEREEEYKTNLKPIFASKSAGASLQSLYSVDMTDAPVTDHMVARKMLYAPRTSFDLKSRSWKLGKSYDGFEDIMDLQDTVYFAGQAIAEKTKRPYMDVVKGLDTFNLLNAEIRGNSELSKALDTSDTSSFIPTQFSARLLDDVRLQLKVAALFGRLSLPRSPFTNPARGTRITAYLVGESTSNSSTKIPTSDPPSRNVTWTAIKFAVRNVFSDELAEDSIVPIMPWVRSELVQGMADAEEDSCINGDDQTTHQHSDVTAATDRRKAFDGLLLHSGGSSGAAAVSLATYSIANMRSIRKAMGRFGVTSSKLAYIMSMSSYITALSLDEVETVDKFGPMATILAGELAKVDGTGIVVSEFVRNDLNASGVYDGATTTKTEIFLVHTPSFLWGDVGAAKSETARDIETGQTVVVTSRRTDFQQIHSPASSGEETVGLGYNIAS